MLRGRFRWKSFIRSRLFRIVNVDKVNLHLLCRLHAYHQWGPFPGSDDLVRVMYRLEQEPKGTLQLFDHGFCKDYELDVWMFVVEEFSKLGNAFSVGVGFEFETLCLQKCSELFIVGDDTIV